MLIPIEYVHLRGFIYAIKDCPILDANHNAQEYDQKTSSLLFIYFTD